MAKVTLLGFTQHPAVIQTKSGEQKIPVAEGQAIACFMVEGHTEDETHQILRRMESVANITPEQIRQLEDYTAPLRGEMRETDAPPAEGEQLAPPTYPENAQPLASQAAQPDSAPLATENAAAEAEPVQEPAAAEVASDSEITQTWGDH